MVYRIYVEKKKELANEAKSLLNELVHLLGIHHLEDVRILNRYDVEDLDEEIFRKAIPTVFSEPQTDLVYESIEDIRDVVFAVEYLPGQFDQRADSAAKCIKFI